MTTRTFIVFQDIPSEPLSTLKTDVVSVPSSSIQPTVLAAAPTPVTTAEKENLHPVTGARAGAVTDPQSKKRKNGVLATKLHIPSTAKKQRDTGLDLRKRRPSAASSSKPRKDGRASSSAATDLSRVEEDVEAELQDQNKATQAEVDSKCYDLTVSPLADVSHAFDQVSLAPAGPRSEHSRVLSPKKPTHNENGTVPLKSKARPASPKEVDAVNDETFFSTPERKQIYAAFTFSSPSPSSKRFTTSHLDIFGDIRFDP
ncbi:hypothetical protein BC834DRAFT_463201 [Gloeopeniophorella convolvens]|nr:hypothetical protein BC834DRAFT_463201 [Gloeopeniophorella convolvens]